MELGSGQPPEPRVPPERPSQPAQPPTPPQKPGSAPKLSERLRQPRIAAAIGIALAIIIILVLVLAGGDDEGGSDEPAASGEAEAASVEDLQELADSVEHPVYWAGEQEGKQYELTVSEEGNIFVRYLDADVEIGSRDVASLTIGTYPVPDAFGALQKNAKQPGALRGKTPDGGLVVSNEASANSVYIAYPGTDIQIEVYDPNPKLAFETATSGEIEPIE